MWFKKNQAGSLWGGNKMNNIKSNTQNYKVEISEENQLLSNFESLIKDKINVETKLLKIKKDIVRDSPNKS